MAGIHRGAEGAYSIALSGGYDDNIDLGDCFTYTGEGNEFCFQATPYRNPPLDMCHQHRPRSNPHSDLIGRVSALCPRGCVFDPCPSHTFRGSLILVYTFCLDLLVQIRHI